jgi:hypothetical protein
MHFQDPSSSADDQFFLDVSAFLVEPVPDTGIRLLRARPETEPALASQLNIPHRLELLLKSAERTSALEPQHPSPTKDAYFTQNCAPVGQTGSGESIYLILSLVVDRLEWTGGWCLAVVPSDESERFQTYLADAYEAIVAQLQHRAEVQP